MKGCEKIFRIWFSFMIITILLSCFVLCVNISYFVGRKNGYEEAIKDIGNGNPKCYKENVVSEKYVWRTK